MAVVADAADPPGGVEVYIDGDAWHGALDVLACAFCLQSVAARVASRKHLNAVAVDLIALHHLLVHIDGVGYLNDGLVVLGGDLLLVLRLSSLLLVRGFVLWCGRLLLLFRFDIFWLFGHSGRAVDKGVDALVLGHADFAFTRVALLQPFGESRLCIGCRDAADTQYDGNE